MQQRQQVLSLHRTTGQLSTLNTGLCFGVIAVCAATLPVVFILAQAPPPPLGPVGHLGACGLLFAASAGLSVSAWWARRSGARTGHLGSAVPMWLTAACGLMVLLANAAVATAWARTGRGIDSSPLGSSLFTGLSLHAATTAAYILGLAYTAWAELRRKRPMTLRARAAVLQAISLPVGGLGMICAFAAAGL
jgi:heme/copper-type cytochrome/quinol oxidase subunit 3